jgi:hypothetical protein
MLHSLVYLKGLYTPVYNQRNVKKGADVSVPRGEIERYRE